MPERTRRDFLNLLAASNPRTRKTTTRIIEGKVSEDDVAFVQEEMSFVQPDATVRSVNLIVSRRCDQGHLQDQQTRLVAVCEICGACTCSTPGCGFTCARCGIAICRRHASVWGQNEAYCPRCRWFALLRRLVVGNEQRSEEP